MTKKKRSVSSQPEKRIRMSAESIWNKPLSDRQKETLDRVAKRQKQVVPSEIDHADIPALRDKQLSQFKRPPKKLVAVRLDADVYDRLQQFGLAIVRASTGCFGPACLKTAGDNRTSMPRSYPLRNAVIYR